MSISTIVVGVDGDAASHAALRVAVDEAVLRRCRVLVMACWSSGAGHLADRSDGREGDTLRKALTIAQQAVSSVVVDDRERSMIIIDSSEGDPGPMLVHASRHATFLVVGSTTRGTATRGTPKSVVDHCLRFCDVPVIVVPHSPLIDTSADLRAS